MFDDYNREFFESWDAYKEYDESYGLEIEGLQAILAKSDPVGYYNDFVVSMSKGKNYQYIRTVQQLQELLDKLEKERSLRIWGHIMYLLPDTVKKIDDKLRSVVNCIYFSPSNPGDNPVRNCFMCRKLFNDNNGSGCGSWFWYEIGKEHDRLYHKIIGLTESKPVYMGYAEKVIDVLKSDPVAAAFYLDWFDVWHMNEDKRWEEFKERIYKKITPSATRFPEIIKDLKQLEKRTLNKEAKYALRCAIKTYKQALSEYEMACYVASQKAKQSYNASTHNDIIKKQADNLKAMNDWWMYNNFMR